MKKDLIILHGALGAKDQFTELSDLLANYFNIHCINFSGHGGHAFEEDFSIDQFALELKNYIQEKELEEVFVFGYSMGGYVALKAASKGLSAITKIFTLGTKFDWNPSSTAKEIKMLNADIIAEKVPHFAKALSDRHAPNDWKLVLSKTADLMLKLANGASLNTEELQAIQIPVCISLGEKDNMVSLEESKETVSNLSTSKFFHFDGFKHPIEKVDNNVLAKAILDFLL